MYTNQSYSDLKVMKPLQTIISIVVLNASMVSAIQIHNTTKSDIIDYSRTLSSDIQTGNIYDNFLNKTKRIKSEIESTSLEVKAQILSREAPWLEEFYRSAHKLDSIMDVVPYYEKIDGLARRQKFDICNNILTNLDINKTSDMLLVGLLRMTYPYHDKLSKWNEFLINSKEALSNNGHNAELELAGLL
jgi:hypothetical protein